MRLGQGEAGVKVHRRDVLDNFPGSQGHGEGVHLSQVAGLADGVGLGSPPGVVALGLPPGLPRLARARKAATLSTPRCASRWARIQPTEVLGSFGFGKEPFAPLVLKPSLPAVVGGPVDPHQGLDLEPSCPKNLALLELSQAILGRGIVCPCLQKGLGFPYSPPCLPANRSKLHA